MRRDPQVMFCLGSTAQIVLITALMTPLTYVAGATNFPLQDANLLAIDRALGLDWRGLCGLRQRPAAARDLAELRLHHDPLADLCDPGGAGGGVSLPAAAGVHLRLRDRADRDHGRCRPSCRRSACSSRSGSIRRTFANIDPRAYLAQQRDLGPVRDGVLRELDLLNLAGIVTFPSFHACSAVLYAWALWPVWWMRPVALLANGAMLASTPVDGGHYFIDLFAGIAVAVLAIVAARR